MPIGNIKYPINLAFFKEREGCGFKRDYFIFPIAIKIPKASQNSLILYSNTFS